MAKLEAKKLSATPLAGTEKAAAASKYSRFVEQTYDEPVERGLVIVIHGAMGVGKTTFASTASEEFPSELPSQRHSGSKAKYVLRDMFWLSIDKKATAGFRERGISVPQFDVPHFRQTPELYKAASFVQPPNIFQACEFGLKVAADYGPKWLVVDTVSLLDRDFNAYWMDHCPSNASGKKDTRGMYGEILAWHLAFCRQAMLVASGVIFVCHSKALIETDNENQRNAAQVLTTASGGQLIPDITGKGALSYKGHASVQLAVMARQAPGGKLKRTVSTVRSADHETKNRWELSLAAEEEPHLGKIMAKVSA